MTKGTKFHISNSVHLLDMTESLRATLKPANALPSVINSTRHKYLKWSIPSLLIITSRSVVKSPRRRQERWGVWTMRGIYKGRSWFIEWCSGEQCLRFSAGLLPLRQRHLQSRAGSFLLRLIMLVFTGSRSLLRALRTHCAKPAAQKRLTERREGAVKMATHWTCQCFFFVFFCNAALLFTILQATVQFCFIKNSPPPNLKISHSLSLESFSQCGYTGPGAC